MFPPRRWSYSWLKAHCEARFGVTPAPSALVEEWGFDAEGLVAQGASRILFTNGLTDGWSAGGFLANVREASTTFHCNPPSPFRCTSTASPFLLTLTDSHCLSLSLTVSPL